jgi:hypothetical protein
MNINLITIIVIFIFFIGSVQVYAQKDTVFTKITTETGTLEQQEMTTEAERLFGTHVPAKWVIKFARNFGNDNNYNFNSPYNIGVEYKIRPSMSIAANYSFDKTDYDFSHFISLEQRWYYQMSKYIAEGKSATNLTGRYIGLNQTVNYQHYSIPEDKKGEASYGLKLRYGIQNRFKKYGFFDFSAGLGVAYAPSQGGYNKLMLLTFDQTFRVGLGVFDNYKEADFSGNYCSVLRCFEEDKQMWKINGLGAIRITQGYGSNGKVSSASLIPNIAFEQKLGNLPLSVEVSTSLTLNAGRYNQRYSPNNNSTLKIQRLSNLANLEFRWYHNQTRRIATGKGGNNLSGPFMAVNADYRYDLGQAKINGTKTQNTIHQASYNLLWGYQLRIYKHGYAQFRVGSGVNNVLFENQRREWNWVTDFKVGYAF